MLHLVEPWRLPDDIAEQLQALANSGQLNKKELLEVETALLHRLSQPAICHKPISTQKNAPQLPSRGV
ncbi:hypothetical protein PAF17_00415 [Paracoccus sp. Z330]|uniref:Uncharacterized protein n=1 Tax=Paracoccus onchidii TaxID=3017813 RepID=A0ABT4Z9E9_9RHOB|nr:hypothetical protein [Paracoccus onchidii]MDB6175968.1 hypothetical protein [Paracoccus onchidii]